MRGRSETRRHPWCGGANMHRGQVLSRWYAVSGRSGRLGAAGTTCCPSRLNGYGSLSKRRAGAWNRRVWYLDWAHLMTATRGWQTGPWRAILGGDQASAAVAVARAVATRLRERERV